MLQLIELALKAPTGSNAQNWEFIVVRDPAVKAKLGRLNRRAWNIYGGIGRRMAARSGDAEMGKILDAVQWQADHFEEVPVIVVACLKAMIPSGRRRRRRASTARSSPRCRISCSRRAPPGSARR